jgi:hypothetical protein
MREKLFFREKAIRLAMKRETFKIKSIFFVYNPVSGLCKLEQDAINIQDILLPVTNERNFYNFEALTHIMH